jgi:TatD DNase family protein
MIYACVGFHPHDASKADERSLAEIEELTHHPKVVAVGEIGLDYHYNFSPPERQRQVFSNQIGIARRRNLPIVIHSREAEEDTLRIVEEAYDGKPARDDGGPGGVFHCFPGDVSMAKKVIGWGFYISIPGPVTFPVKPNKPNAMVGVASVIPLEHMLLETDSPYLTPVPLRGKRNEPSHIPLIARKISELQGIPVERVGDVTSEAACVLFSLGKHQRKSSEEL